MMEKLILHYWKVGFNLNLLECKSVYQTSFATPSRVLISTYWNVNLESHAEVIGKIEVLISTYWNVNFSFDKDIQNSMQF